MEKINCKHALTDRGWESNLEITIIDGLISDIRRDDSLSNYDVDTLLPAPLNLHSHSFQRAMAGLTEKRGDNPSDSFWTWRKLMYKYLDRLTPDHIEIIASQVFMEMAQSGYASVAEFHYLHNAPNGIHYDHRAELASRINNAAQNVGLGLTLLPVLYSYGGCDLRPLQGGQLRFKNSFEDFLTLHSESEKIIASSHNDYRIGVAPHSLRAVSEEDLYSCVKLAGSAPLHLHLAEQIAEVEEVQAARGARPVEWLLGNVGLSENFCLIHVTQMTKYETKALAKTGAIAGLCPLTESSLGDGIFDGMTYQNSNGRFGVGSDSNIHISLFEELKTLDYSQRLRDHTRAPYADAARSSGRNVFDRVCEGGALAGGRNSGAIKIGKFADLIAIDRDNPWLCNRTGDNILDGLIFGGHSQECITDVWSAGRHIVKNGCHIKRDEIKRNFTVLCQELGEAI